MRAMPEAVWHTWELVLHPIAAELLRMRQPGLDGVMT